MTQFNAQAQFTIPTGQLSPEAVRYINALLAAIKDLQSRVAALEGP